MKYDPFKDREEIRNLLKGGLDTSDDEGLYPEPQKKSKSSSKKGSSGTSDAFTVLLGIISIIALFYMFFGNSFWGYMSEQKSSDVPAQFVSYEGAGRSETSTQASQTTNLPVRSKRAANPSNQSILKSQELVRKKTDKEALQYVKITGGDGDEDDEVNIENKFSSKSATSSNLPNPANVGDIPNKPNIHSENSEELKGHYNNLDKNYDTLNQNYDTLNQNYDTLDSKFTNLDSNYTSTDSFFKDK